VRKHQPQRSMRVFSRGWASGGWMADTLVDGNVDSGSQQQWISRNSEWRSWTSSNWNMVFVGVPNPPQGEWPNPPYTKVNQTPIVREKPFLEPSTRNTQSDPFVPVPCLKQFRQAERANNGPSRLL
jgi:hypothetical protein